MVRALLINEVASNVCVYLDNPSLGSLARTSKMFHDPALRVLWENIADISPLVRAFPEDAWTIEERKLIFTRALHPDDWSAFLKYSHLVRFLGGYRSPIYLDIHWSLGPSVLQELCSQRPVITLLPNLRSFSWLGLRLPGELYPLLVSICGKRLHTADMNIHNIGRDSKLVISSAIATLAHNSPYLRILSLSTETAGLSSRAASAVSSAFSTHLQTFQDLREFYCVTAPLPVEAIVALASLPSLVECNILLPQDGKWPSNSSIPQSFPRLRQLYIIGTVDAYAAFSRAIVCPVVQQLEFDVKTIPESRAVPELVRAIRRQFSPTHLQSITIFSAVGLQPDEISAVDTGAIILSAHIRPLLEFPRLQYLDFSPPWVYQLDDQLCLSMAEAWPLLEEFRLANDASCVVDRIGITLRSLPPFAIHCPHLKYLAIDFDASLVGPVGPGSVPEEFYGDLLQDGRRLASTSRLQTLEVQRSAIAHAEGVAVYLSAVFPELEGVAYGAWSAGGASEPTDAGQLFHRMEWEKVSQYLKMLRTVRLDERRCWEGRAAC